MTAGEASLDALIPRAVESLRGSRRAERFGPGLARLARELADARRQIASLRHENAQLRARLARADDRAIPVIVRRRGQPRLGGGGGPGA